MAEQEQYVTLGMGEEVFAIPVAHVQEILDLRPVARACPMRRTALLGLTDVRGQSVAVVELRALLGLQPAEAEPRSSQRILVLELAIAGRSLRLGLLVDRVFEVTGLDADRAEPAPDIGRPLAVRLHPRHRPPRRRLRRRAGRAAADRRGGWRGADARRGRARGLSRCRRS
jgi:purine-binding chemotaxis protein CheW